MFQNNQKPYTHREGNISRDREREKKQDKKTGKIGKNITNVFLYFIFAVNLVYFFEKKKNLEVRLFLVQYIPVIVCPPSALPDFLCLVFTILNRMSISSEGNFYYFSF